MTIPAELETYTVEETAVLLKIKRNLAYRLCASGEIPAVRLGKRIVVPRVALEDFLRNPRRPREVR